MSEQNNFIAYVESAMTEAVAHAKDRATIKSFQDNNDLEGLLNYVALLNK